MYEVRWTHPAVADLQAKVRSGFVRQYLLAVGRTALDRYPGEWGGRLDNDFWWRRGVLAQHEVDPDAIPQGDDDGGEMPYDFVLAYLRASVTRVPRRFLVLGVLTNPELVAGPADLFADGRLAPWTRPPAPARERPRLSRPRGGRDRR